MTNGTISAEARYFSEASNTIISLLIKVETITRKIAWESGKNTIVLNGGFFKDKDQLYVRSNKNVKPLIKRGKSLGFKCGGKKEVLGAIIPKNKTDCFVEEIIEFLSKNKR